jgi:hypothetical protein
VINLDVRLSGLAEDFEGVVFDIGLDFCVVKFTTNESFGVEDPVRDPSKTVS